MSLDATYYTMHVIIFVPCYYKNEDCILNCKNVIKITEILHPKIFEVNPLGVSSCMSCRLTYIVTFVYHETRI